MNKITATALSCGLAILGSAQAASSSKPSSYHEIGRFTVGGEGGWDYLTVDSRHRLFLSRGSHVMVVNTTTGKVMGDIPETTGVHGIAFAPKIHRGFTSNGRDNTVTEFNLDTLQVIKKIPVTGKNPDCIIFEPVTGRVFTFNGGSGDASAIDPAEEAEVGKVSMGGKLEFAAPDGHGHVFVNNESSNEIFEFDAASLQVVKKWSIAPADGPSGLSLDVKHHRLFSVTDGKMVVSDTTSGKVLTNVEIGDGPDASAFDPKLDLAFSSNGGSATLSVVHEDSPEKFTVVQTVKTEPGARTMALDPTNHRVYLVTAKFAPSAPAAQGSPRQRRQMLPNSFVVLVYGF